MFKDQKGSAFFLTIAVLAVIILLTVIVLEWYGTVTMADSIDTELSRALKSSIDLAVMDEYRKDGVSVMDCGKAELEFYNYIHNAMSLDGDFNCYVSDKFIYSLNIKNIEFTAEPPQIYVEGYVKIAPVFFNMFNSVYEIKFSKGVRNMRLD